MRKPTSPQSTVACLSPITAPSVLANTVNAAQWESSRQGEESARVPPCDAVLAESIARGSSACARSRRGEA
eukprot:2580729-Pleurochrysis_carterae.AAC.1